ncbi:hypothetical protein PROAA_1040009 [Candidatus Propionivibrio aalborgensis]|uniref:Uncharacterized protein n=1 Tax=Candidatus Propionivibrio aalborgensis TaxID=1860101 RepID=A0A1A8XF71_9RHOO|nr:hypothetical protein [Candidatus Propionivibrio aalborgensis]SBT03376.1 hypothetical protein PROAA_1040009 [Candidatus Propionivibrio aalborgensis]
METKEQSRNTFVKKALLKEISTLDFELEIDFFCSDQCILRAELNAMLDALPGLSRLIKVIEE